MKGIIKLIVILLLVAAGAGGGYYYLQQSNVKAEQDRIAAALDSLDMKADKIEIDVLGNGGTLHGLSIKSNGTISPFTIEKAQYSGFKKGFLDTNSTDAIAGSLTLTNITVVSLPGEEPESKQTIKEVKFENVNTNAVKLFTSVARKTPDEAQAKKYLLNSHVGKIAVAGYQATMADPSMANVSIDSIVTNNVTALPESMQTGTTSLDNLKVSYGGKETLSIGSIAYASFNVPNMVDLSEKLVNPEMLDPTQLLKNSKIQLADGRIKDIRCSLDMVLGTSTLPVTIKEMEIDTLTNSTTSTFRKTVKGLHLPKAAVEAWLGKEMVVLKEDIDLNFNMDLETTMSDTGYFLTVKDFSIGETKLGNLGLQAAMQMDVTPNTPLAMFGFRAADLVKLKRVALTIEDKGAIDLVCDSVALQLTEAGTPITGAEIRKARATEFSATIADAPESVKKIVADMVNLVERPGKFTATVDLQEPERIEGIASQILMGNSKNITFESSFTAQ